MNFFIGNFERPAIIPIPSKSGLGISAKNNITALPHLSKIFFLNFLINLCFSRFKILFDEKPKRKVVLSPNEAPNAPTKATSSGFDWVADIPTDKRPGAGKNIVALPTKFIKKTPISPNDLNEGYRI